MEQKSLPGGYDLMELEAGGAKDSYINYAVSKAANVIIANEMGRCFGKDGIISVSYSSSLADPLRREVPSTGLSSVSN